MQSNSASPKQRLYSSLKKYAGNISFPSTSAILFSSEQRILAAVSIFALWGPDLKRMWMSFGIPSRYLEAYDTFPFEKKVTSYFSVSILFSRLKAEKLMPLTRIVSVWNRILFLLFLSEMQFDLSPKKIAFATFSHTFPSSLQTNLLTASLYFLLSVLSPSFSGSASQSAISSALWVVGPGSSSTGI